MGKGYPQGLHAARKLRNRRRINRWKSKRYRKAHLGAHARADPFEGASHAKGIVLEKVFDLSLLIHFCSGVEAKQPHSAVRKCVRCQLLKNGKRVSAFVPRDGSLNFIEINDEVLIAGFGRSGHAIGDIPGIRFKIVKVAGVSLTALYLEKKEKPRA